VVSTYDTNAWKLGGYAMYATPPARTRVVIFERRGSQKIRIEGDLPDTLVEERLLYGVTRGVLGSLWPPDALAQAYFQARPEMDHLEVEITREMVSASTARIERREFVYKYDRSPVR
jgi:hypothetical protein